MDIIKEPYTQCFIFEDGTIGYLAEICTCDRCKERGASEYYIRNKNGDYMDCLPVGTIPDGVVYLGDSLEMGIKTLVRHFERGWQNVNEEVLIWKRLCKELEKKLVENLEEDI